MGILSYWIWIFLLLWTVAKCMTSVYLILDSRFLNLICNRKNGINWILFLWDITYFKSKTTKNQTYTTPYAVLLGSWFSVADRKMFGTILTFTWSSTGCWLYSGNHKQGQRSNRKWNMLHIHDSLCISQYSLHIMPACWANHYIFRKLHLLLPSHLLYAFNFHVISLSHLAGSTLRTRNKCHSSMFVLCSVYVLLLSTKCVRVRRCSLQILSCEAYIFCRIGDFVTV